MHLREVGSALSHVVNLSFHSIMFTVAINPPADTWSVFCTPGFFSENACSGLISRCWLLPKENIEIKVSTYPCLFKIYATSNIDQKTEKDTSISLIFIIQITWDVTSHARLFTRSLKIHKVEKRILRSHPKKTRSTYNAHRGNVI